ncbi:MAG: fibronectin type III domain-containing protein, partial [Candidatus Scalindua sp.]|nr:fibronectin type III domain-containing protein [Candidatus Scalindua sp.]
TLNPTATDLDGDALTFTYSGWMSSNSYTTSYNDAGVHTVTVTVSDGSLTDSQAVMVTVKNSNRKPVLNPIANIVVNEGVTISLNPTATDPDGDALTFTYSGWMSSNSYTTSYDDAGVHTVTVTVSDGSLTDSKNVTITVINANRAPVLNPIANIVVNEGDTVILNPTATDPDGNALTFTYSGWMSSKSYTTSYNDAGVHTVTVTVSDGSMTDSQDITITVNEGTVQVTLKWDPNTEEDLAGYKIYYSNSAGIYDSSVDVGNQTSYTVSGLVSNKTYYFAATAYDSSGNESDYSDEVIHDIPAY